MPKILKYVSLALLILMVVFLLTCNHILAGIAASFVPTAYVWVFVPLLLIEGTAFFWIWRGLFVRRPHLVFEAEDSDSPESEARRKQLAHELTTRLNENTYLKNDGLAVDHSNPASLKVCLDKLREKADEAIRRTAKHIFLATAVSQNGRIDAIIVFASLCHLVWRISKIYDQRPHPKKMVSLYWAVVTSTFIAFAFEEAEIATEVGIGFGQALQAMAPATMLGGVPLVGAALRVFTASAIDGAANCFLALRTGIIARNVYDYALKAEKRPDRAKVFKEAGSVLLRMSYSLIEQSFEVLRPTSKVLRRMSQAAKDKADRLRQDMQKDAKLTIDEDDIAKEVQAAVRNLY